MFLYIVPLKQGLKPIQDCISEINDILFLYIVPLKQGLKLSSAKEELKSRQVFIHSSIKTRIETGRPQKRAPRRARFLYIVPLKQGLKLNIPFLNEEQEREFLYIVPLKQGLKPT